MDPAHPVSDARLLERSATDPHAFEELFVRHATQINNWLAARTRSASTGLDLTAETFAQAWASRHRFTPPDDGGAGPWLQGIAANLYRSWAHTERVETSARERLGMRTEPEPDAAERAIDRVDAAAAGGAALHQLDELPAKQRDAIRLRVLDELSYEEIATHLSCTPIAARVRVMRGLRTLNARLKGRTS